MSQSGKDVMTDRPTEAPEDAIGSRIRSAREARGLSQTAVSTRSKAIDPKGQGISRTVLVGYEAGNSKPGARELRLLSETLGVTPTWLIYGSDDGHESAQASLEVFRNRNDLVSALRLALAIAVLRTHERGAFTSLVLSMAGRELGDMKLSALLALGAELAGPVFEQIRANLPEGFDKNTPLDAQELSNLVAKLSETVTTNVGNRLLLDEDGDPVGGEWLYREPQE
jgi:transcriptional regulator with XRE-family HTH domain